MFRDAARWLGEHDPLVQLTARKSTVALATTRDTAARLNSLGASNVRVLGEIGLRQEEVERLGSMPLPEGEPFRFISIGRILHWKGFHLGLQAFAQAQLGQAEYWVVGDGPERERLRSLAAELGIAERVKFWGVLPREVTLRKLGESHALVHPSLHDSGGWVCMEAMAARRPVLCLDLGGPAYQVIPSSGFKVAPHSPKQAVKDLAEAMRSLATNRELCVRMGEAGHQRVLEQFTWRKRAEVLASIYHTVAASSAETVEVT